MNFSSQNQEDDVTPFFNGNPQQCTIFDNFSEKESQKSVFNMFNENTSPDHNFQYSNGGSQYDSQSSIPYKTDRNGTKHSKQSIIEQLNDYDFRNRFEQIEQKLLKEQATQQFSVSNYRQNQEQFSQQSRTNRQNTEEETPNTLLQSTVKQFKEQDFYKKLDIQQKSTEMDSNEYRFEKYEKSSHQNLGNIERRKTDRLPLKSSNAFQIKNRESRCKIDQSNTKIPQKISISKQQFKFQEKMPREENIAEETIKQPPKQHKPQSKPQHRAYYKPQRKPQYKQQSQNKPEHKQIVFNFNFKKSRVKEIDDPQNNSKTFQQKMNTKSFKPIAPEITPPKGNKQNWNTMKKQQDQKEEDNKKVSIGLKEELANREKRFTEKLKFKLKGQSTMGNLSNRETIKLSKQTHAKNKEEKLSVVKPSQNNKEKFNINPQRIFLKKKEDGPTKTVKTLDKAEEITEQAIELKTKQSQQNRQSKVKDFKDNVRKIHQQFFELEHEILDKVKGLRRTKSEYLRMNSHLNKYNMLLDSTKSHNLSQTMNKGAPNSIVYQRLERGSKNSKIGVIGKQ